MASTVAEWRQSEFWGKADGRSRALIAAAGPRISAAAATKHQEARGESPVCPSGSSPASRTACGHGPVGFPAIRSRSLTVTVPRSPVVRFPPISASPIKLSHDHQAGSLSIGDPVGENKCTLNPENPFPSELSQQNSWLNVKFK